jgi:hypothetical protein
VLCSVNSLYLHYVVNPQYLFRTVHSQYLHCTVCFLAPSGVSPPSSLDATSAVTTAMQMTRNDTLLAPSGDSAPVPLDATSAVTTATQTSRNDTRAAPSVRRPVVPPRIPPHIDAGAVLETRLRSGHDVAEQPAPPRKRKSRGASGPSRDDSIPRRDALGASGDDSVPSRDALDAMNRDSDVAIRPDQFRCLASARRTSGAAAEHFETARRETGLRETVSAPCRKPDTVLIMVPVAGGGRMRADEVERLCAPYRLGDMFMGRGETDNRLHW